MIVIEGDKSALYQWDKNMRVRLFDIKEGVQVHFSHERIVDDKDNCPVLFSYKEDDGVYANIPNHYLQESGIITVYIYVEETNKAYTEHHAEIIVIARPKPADYVYEETEVYSIKTAVDKALQEAKDSGEFDGPPGKDGVDGKDGKDGIDGKDAELDDSAIGAKAWSSKRIVDTMCPAFSETGAMVTCQPMENYPLEVICESSRSASPGYMWVGVNLWRFGKNLAENLKTEETTIAGVQYTQLGDGRFMLSGTADKTTITYLNNSVSIELLKDVQYMIKDCQIAFTKSDGTTGTCNNKAFTPTENVTVTAIRYYFKKDEVYDGIYEPMIMVDTGDYTFVPFSHYEKLFFKLSRGSKRFRYNITTGELTSEYGVTYQEPFQLFAYDGENIFMTNEDEAIVTVTGRGKHEDSGNGGGKDGKDGISATHRWNGTVLTVTSASGTSSADLKGDKGDKGEKGDKGDKGAKGDPGVNGKDGVDGQPGKDGVDGKNGTDGYTPVRGTDYWTEEDKAEIMNEVGGDIESALDHIIEIQNSLIGGEV